MFLVFMFLCAPFAVWLTAAVFWTVISHVIVWVVVVAVILLALWLVGRLVKR